jgi:small subunit ribosomal protein S21
MNEEIIKDTKRHAFYLKPGQRKRIKSAEARKRARKNKSRSRDDLDPKRS